MLVIEYILKLKSYKDETVIKIIKSKEPFTEQQIEDILIEYKNEADYCETSMYYRLHSKTLHSR
jgi:ABC-type sulfate transport system substrate-binding protein